MPAAGSTRTLSWGWYTDPAVLQLERERLFRRFWQYVGHAGEVAEPGSFRATRAGHVPVVLVRDEDGALRAFLNVCRHRGSLVCEGSGRRASLQCPYHAWTYGLDGRLLAAPRSAREGGIETDELGLAPSPARAVGTVPLRQPGCGRACALRRPGGRTRAHRSRRRRRRRPPLPAALRVASSRPTGRSAPRTSSSATTALSRIPASPPSWMCLRTRTCSRPSVG